MNTRIAKFSTLAAAVGVALVAMSAPALAGDVDVVATGNRMVFTPGERAPGYQLRITGPGPFLIERVFTSNEAMAVNAGVSWQNGSYSYEIAPITGMDVRSGTAAVGGAAVSTDPGLLSSGVFAMDAGRLLIPTSVPEWQRPNDFDSGASGKDQVIPDDLIVQGSGCFGFDCVNNESFGFDTIRLKENNLRIKFEDTSVGAFPSTDWQLTANDSASGGANKFSIEDITAARVPFTVSGGAGTNSLFIDSSSRVGFGTSTPVLQMHQNNSNTPALRLEQNNSGGFTAQTWDIAGNEANFFIRDVTGGSRLPFRIRPGAPTSSLDISASGNVGIGTASPSQSLHVFGSDGSTTALVQETNGTVQGRTLLQLINNGPTRFKLNDSSTGVGWVMNATGNEYRISVEGAVTTPFTFQSDGDLIITGVLTQGSSRDMKHNFRPLDGADILARLRALEVTRWNYRDDAQQTEHIGPMSQDFNAAFAVGERDDRLAMLDVNGVTVVAIQELARQLDERDERIAMLERRLEELQQATAKLAAQVATALPPQTLTVSSPEQKAPSTEVDL